MDKMATIEQRIADIVPDDDADYDLTDYTIQCHLVGFIAGAIVTCIVGWLVAW